MMRRQPIPDVMANAPELGLGLEFFYEAFLELSTCRAVGFGVGPIPWVAMDRYARRYGVAGEDFDRFRQLIRALDEVFMAHANKGKEGSA